MFSLLIILWLYKILIMMLTRERQLVSQDPIYDPDAGIMRYILSNAGIMR